MMLITQIVVVVTYISLDKFPFFSMKLFEFKVFT